MASIPYRTVTEPGSSEVVEKKSRFLGEAVHVDTLEDAEAYIAAVRKKHYDARHHCFAFAVGEPGTPDEILRFSDDGEPSGTAGKPMLDILTGRDLHKTLFVVTRYFGGTLLGTGGLVRAYSAAAKEAVDAAVISGIRPGVRLRISCPYPSVGKLQHLFAGEGLEIERTDYAEAVTFFVIAPAEAVSRIIKRVTEATDGRAACGELDRVEYTLRG